MLIWRFARGIRQTEPPLCKGTFGEFLGEEMAPVSSVECHAGYAYPERPIAFSWQGERLEIDRVEAEWRTPEGKYFRVSTRDGQRFDLFYRELASQWEINPV